MNDIEISQDSFRIKEESQVVLYLDPSKDNNSIVELINKAQQQDCNCLDLTKRNIQEFPRQLLEFSSLQVMNLSTIWFLLRIRFLFSICISKEINSHNYQRIYSFDYRI